MSKFMTELPGKNDFEKLRCSLLCDSQIESEKRTPKYYRDQNHHTEKAELKSIRSQYARDLDRILQEIDLIISILKTFPDDSYLKKINISKPQYALRFSPCIVHSSTVK